MEALECGGTNSFVPRVLNPCDVGQAVGSTAIERSLHALDELLQQADLQLAAIRVPTPPKTWSPKIVRDELSMRSLSTSSLSSTDGFNYMMPSPGPSYSSLGSEEVRKSLEELDAVLSEYDEDDSCGCTSEAFVASYNRNHCSANLHQMKINDMIDDLPPPPPELLEEAAAAATGRTNGVAQSSSNSQVQRCQSEHQKAVRVAPPCIPKRSPSTRLTNTDEGERIQLQLGADCVNNSIQEDVTVQLTCKQTTNESSSDDCGIDSSSQSVTDIIQRFQKPKSNNSPKPSPPLTEASNRCERVVVPVLPSNPPPNFPPPPSAPLPPIPSSRFSEDVTYAVPYECYSPVMPLIPPCPAAAYPVGKAVPIPTPQLASASPSSQLGPQSSSFKNSLQSVHPGSPKVIANNNIAVRILPPAILPLHPGAPPPPPPPLSCFKQASPSCNGMAAVPAPPPAPPAPPHQPTNLSTFGCKTTNKAVVAKTKTHKVMKDEGQVEANGDNDQGDVGPHLASNSEPGHAAVIAQIQQGVLLRRTSTSTSVAALQVDCAAPSSLFSDSSLGSEQLESYQQQQQNICGSDSDSILSNCTTASYLQQFNSNYFSDVMFDGIDVTQVPGFQVPTENMPEWRRALLDKRNREAVEAFVAARRAEEEEASRWGAMPEWKRKLALQKEQKRREDLAPTVQERRRRQEDEERLAAMPEWKRNLVQKKKMTN